MPENSWSRGLQCSNAEISALDEERQSNRVPEVIEEPVQPLLGLAHAAFGGDVGEPEARVRVHRNPIGAVAYFNLDSLRERFDIDRIEDGEEQGG